MRTSTAHLNSVQVLEFLKNHEEFGFAFSKAVLDPLNPTFTILLDGGALIDRNEDTQDWNVLDIMRNVKVPSLEYLAETAWRAVGWRRMTDGWSKEQIENAERVLKGPSI